VPRTINDDAFMLSRPAAAASVTAGSTNLSHAADKISVRPPARICSTETPLVDETSVPLTVMGAPASGVARSCNKGKKGNHIRTVGLTVGLMTA
jgi:hypothetical protein